MSLKQEQRQAINAHLNLFCDSTKCTFVIFRNTEKQGQCYPNNRAVELAFRTIGKWRKAPEKGVHTYFWRFQKNESRYFREQVLVAASFCILRILYIWEFPLKKTIILCYLNYFKKRPIILCYLNCSIFFTKMLFFDSAIYFTSTILSTIFPSDKVFFTGTSCQTFQTFCWTFNQGLHCDWQ